MPQRAKRRRLIQYITAGVIICAPMAQADPFVSPDIVILDDSQISFGSGPVFLEFFENIKAHCPPPPQATGRSGPFGGNERGGDWRALHLAAFMDSAHGTGQGGDL